MTHNDILNQKTLNNSILYQKGIPLDYQEYPLLIQNQYFYFYIHFTILFIHKDQVAVCLIIYETGSKKVSHSRLWNMATLLKSTRNTIKRWRYFNNHISLTFLDLIRILGLNIVNREHQSFTLYE